MYEAEEALKITKSTKSHKQQEIAGERGPFSVELTASCPGSSGDGCESKSLMGVIEGYMLLYILPTSR